MSAEPRIRLRSHEEIYGSARSYGMEFAYALSDNAEVFGQLRYARADRGEVEVGGAFVPVLATTLPVRGSFGD